MANRNRNRKFRLSVPREERVEVHLNGNPWKGRGGLVSDDPNRPNKVYSFVAPPDCPIQISVNKPLPAPGVNLVPVGIAYGNRTGIAYANNFVNFQAGIVNVFQAPVGNLNFPVGIANTYQAPDLIDLSDAEDLLNPQSPDSKMIG
ncbi:hypothetical protein GQ457_17G026180 [Hibiscus cannabinus]